ncbi:hypothetical protein MRX96_045809 [Rhipicephalus microplus]
MKSARGCVFSSVLLSTEQLCLYETEPDAWVERRRASTAVYVAREVLRCREFATNDVMLRKDGAQTRSLVARCAPGLRRRPSSPFT